MRAELVDREIDAARLVDEVAASGQGATVLFVGTVRDHSDGRPVSGMEYSGYRSMAERELRAIAAESVERYPQLDIVVEHRLGTLRIGDVSVGIATSHPHRDAAYEANRYAIEELKRRAPIWKREHYADGTRVWVDPTHRDPSASAGAARRRDPAGDATSVR